jgi:hypothetical protein
LFRKHVKKEFIFLQLYRCLSGSISLSLFITTSTPRIFYYSRSVPLLFPSTSIHVAEVPWYSNPWSSVADTFLESGAFGESALSELGIVQD